MIFLLQHLEVRMYEANEIILNEIDECHEVLFIQKGTYNIGYEINKVARFRLQFGSRT